MARSSATGRSTVTAEHWKDAQGKTRIRWHSWVSLGSDPITGRRIRRHVTGNSRTEVARKVAELESERAKGVSSRADFARVMDQWLVSIGQNLAPQTVGKSEWAVRRWLRPTFGQLGCHELTPELIEERFRTLASASGEVASQKTKIEVLGRLRACCTWAVKRGLLASNPAALVQLRTPVATRVESLRVSDVERLVAALRHRDDRVRWLVALVTGMRQGEVLGLQWGDLVQVEGSWVLQVTRQWLRAHFEHGCSPHCGKPAARCPQRRSGNQIGTLKTSGSARSVPVPPTLLQALHEHWERQGRPQGKAWMFPGPQGVPLDHRADARRLERLCRKAGIAPASTHVLRHTAATAALMEQVPERVVQELFGWTSTRQLSRYQDVVAWQSQQAVSAMERRLLGA